MTAAAVELDPATLAELVPPCEFHHHKCPASAPPCTCPPEVRRTRCGQSATWALRVVMACGHRTLALACEGHRELINRWLSDPNQCVQCVGCNRYEPPRSIAWERL